MPYLIGRSVDLDTDCENVNIAVALPGGTDMETVEICLSPDGKEAKLSYDWPKDLYVMKELYFEEIKTKKRIDSTILSMNESLKARRTKTDIAPRAYIVLPLPVAVQTDSKTWAKSGNIGNHGGVIAKVTFKAHQKEYGVLDADKRIPFFKLNEGIKVDRPL